MTQPIEIRTQGIGREALFPQAGREEVDVEGGMGIDTLEDVDEVDVGINALQATRREHALHDVHLARPQFRPAEAPVPPADGNGANLPLQVIRIERHGGTL